MTAGNEFSQNINKVKDYLDSLDLMPLFLKDDAYTLLQLLPDDCIDWVITFPPYWGQRDYANAGIGLEKKWEDYIKKLLKISNEIKRALKPTGSFWLNIGDAYHKKSLMGIPWRVAIEMADKQKGKPLVPISPQSIA